MLLVNAAGYLVAPSGPLLGALPDQPGAALLGLQWLYAFAVQGKAYPVLAFLFGIGLWLATRQGERSTAMARARRRQWALLWLGLAHGLLIYFGDVLTAYAIVGAWVLRHVHEPWRTLRPRLWRALGWAVGVMALVTAAVIWAAVRGSVGAGPAEPNFASVRSIPAFLVLNASNYLWLQGATLLLGLPMLRLCMLGGVAAARLRLLSHRRWRGALRRWAVRWAAPALLLNAAYAAGYVALHRQQGGLVLLESVGMLTGPLLSAVMVVAFALHSGGGRAPWLRWLAPLGQRTLTLYVGHGLVCLLLFSGIGAGLQPGLWGLLLFSLLLWAAALAAALASGTRRWPLEAWLARR